MILVDTTVWIDFFKGNLTKQVKYLKKFVEEKEDLAICGIILTEILQGIRSEDQYKKVKNYFEPLVLLEIGYEEYIQAANIFRVTRSKGYTVRNTIDCIIAATAITNATKLLHSDKDFKVIDKFTELEVIENF